MKRKNNYAFILLSLSAVLYFAPSAKAHSDLEDQVIGKKNSHRHKHRKVVKIVKEKSSSDFDPWKLLDLALTPAAAHAASTYVNISSDGNYRTVKSDGIPNHSTGAFPNAGNPNTIQEQDYTFRMLLNPKFSGTITHLSMYPFGVAINGVPFDPGANEFWNGNRNSGWQYEAMSLGPRLGIDQNNAHVQPNGAYHYHGLPTGLLQKLAAVGRPVLLGYAADGFPIYGPFGFANLKTGTSGNTSKLKSSYRLKAGSRPSGNAPGGHYDGQFVQDYEFVNGLGDLDECNGRTAVTAEYPKGTYLYVITDNYPYIPRAFRGTPDETFMRHGHAGGPLEGPGGRGGGQGGRGPDGRVGPSGRDDFPGRDGRPGNDGPPGPGGRDGFPGPGGFPPGPGGGPPPGGNGGNRNNSPLWGDVYR